MQSFGNNVSSHDAPLASTGPHTHNAPAFPNKYVVLKFVEVPLTLHLKSCVVLCYHA